ncbi:MAG: type III-A CRISPR-associated RAMP protein Csm3 [Candidatus Ratteibacteria bacterium]
MRLISIEKIEALIELKTGLHIGAGDTEIHIGGIDNTVVKHPHTLQPYIPGSSIKGKIRSLLEMKSGLMQQTKGGVLSYSILSKISDDMKKRECELILKLFGSGGEKEQEFVLGPTRLSFADAFLDETTIQYPTVENKSENTINRISGTASNPRVAERVPSGLSFRAFLTMKVFERDDSEKMLEILLIGMKLLEFDALGASGSRGYGRIKWKGLKLNDKDIQVKLDAISLFLEGAS